MLINNDVLKEIINIPDNSFDTCFTDPPYQLGSEIMIKDDNQPDYKKAVDFMDKWEGFSGEDWDLFFKELFRVMKDGALVLMYGIDRQSWVFKYYANKHGFQVQQSMYSFFISSFPKSADLSINLDKRQGKEREVVGKRKSEGGRTGKNPYQSEDNNFNGEGAIINITAPASPLAEKYNGFRYSICPLKQTSEEIMVFRKPLPNNMSVLDSVFEYEEGNEKVAMPIFNIDGGRVGTEDFIGRVDNRDIKERGSILKEEKGWNNNNMKQPHTDGNSIGRYPAQTFLVTGFHIEDFIQDDKILYDRLHLLGIYDLSLFQYMDNEKAIEYIKNRIEQFDVSKVLDEQSGITKSWSGQYYNNDFSPYTGNSFQKSSTKREKDVFHKGYGDDSGCSRILHHCRYDIEDYPIFQYCTKVSPKERNTGCEELEDVKSFTCQTNEKRNNDMFSVHDYCIICNKRYDSCKCISPAYEKRKQTNINFMVKNNHPTLKSLVLNKKIFSLVTYPEAEKQKVFIPFSGAGSEYIGTLKNGILEENIIAVELSDEYCEIAKKRIEFWKDVDFKKYEKETSIINPKEKTSKDQGILF